MKNLRLSILTLLTVVLLNSCTFVSNIFKYRDTTKEFVEDLLHKDYDKCIGLMAMDNPQATNTNIDTMKMGLDNFRGLIVRNFGDKLNYSFMSGEKKWSSTGSGNTPPNTTVVQVQFDNNKEFGVFQVLFDDNSKRILNIKALEVKEPIPSMTAFWFFGLLAICIPIFNIYMIVRVKRSKFKKKWLKYLAIIFLNVPAITYKAVGGLSLGLLSFQVLLGVSFSYMGYLNSAWTFGLPLGGLYILWQLYKKKDEPIEEIQNEITETEQQIDSNANTEDTISTDE